jgi:hypothetical protein
MDILAVNQESDEARLSVVKHIPEVYQNARKTIMVREDGGFCSCYTYWMTLLVAGDDEHGQGEHLKHMKDFHPNGLEEIWLRRLWPLQEANLSRTLEFTVCERATEDDRNPAGLSRSMTLLGPKWGPLLELLNQRVYQGGEILWAIWKRTECNLYHL